jgi:hypothetical protein
MASAKRLWRYPRNKENSVSKQRLTNGRWSTRVLFVLTAGALLVTGCTTDPGTSPAAGDPLKLLGGAVVGATDAKTTAQGQDDPNADPNDGDSQMGEFEGEHQFGANDQIEDDTNDGAQVGPNEEVEDGAPDGEGEDAEGNELKASLSGSGTTAVVEYQTGTSRTKFEVRVTGGQANATLDVAVNGLVFTWLALGADGSGTLELASTPHEPDEQTLPGDFPVLVAGDLVAVGNLSGPLVIEP